MRDNQPVTGREVMMRDDMLIVSSTDEKGRIKFMNRDFLEIAGFAKEELLGQPHNMIRHPDMPPEAFEDMWRDLKAGKPWSGYVKNRTKNGDHYWVLANAMPVVENGRTAGYVSIRRKPERDMVSAVDAIYKKFRQGQTDGLKIEHGRVIGSTTKEKAVRWFARFGSKITVMGVVLCVLLATVAGVGVYYKQKTAEALRTVYEDRTIPVGQLADIDALLYKTFAHSALLAVGKADATKLIKETEEAIVQINTIWDAYMATYLTPEEKILADRYATLKTEYVEKSVRPALDLVRAGKLEELGTHLVGMGEAFEVTESANRKLIQLQLDISKEAYEQSKIDGRVGLMIAMIITLLSIVLVVVASRRVTRIINARLQQADDALTSIAGGKFDNVVVVGEDELQNTMTLVNALQAKLAYNELEKRELEREKKLQQEALANRFDQEVGEFINGIGAAATELQSTAESMGQVAADTQNRSTAVAAASEEATSNVQTVSAASEELAASVQEIRNQVSQSSSKIVEAVQQANATNEKVRALTDAAEKIGSVVDMIREIAGQTNLLALNATIEAARAGEAGKGFAVVASEVKSLAGQTAKATEEISDQVAQIQQETRTAADAIQLIVGRIDDVNAISSTIAHAVTQQGEATEEIARNVAEAAAGTQEVSSNIQGVREATQSTGAAAAQVLTAASELAKNSELLKEKVRVFISGMRG